MYVYADETSGPIWSLLAMFPFFFVLFSVNAESIFVDNRLSSQFQHRPFVCVSSSSPLAGRALLLFMCDRCVLLWRGNRRMRRRKEGGGGGELVETRVGDTQAAWYVR